MASISVKRKRGRPATGTDPLVCARLPEDLIAAFNSFAQREELTRSEVIRVAVAEYLKRKRALPGCE